MIIFIIKHMFLFIWSFSIKKLMCYFITLTMFLIVNDLKNWELVHHLNDFVIEDYFLSFNYIFNDETYAYNHFLK